MKWNDYYDRFWDWAESTRISRISTLTDFNSAAEVAELAAMFFDEMVASRLVKRALEHGVRFSPDQILELANYLNEETICETLRCRQGEFTAEQYEELLCWCDDDDLLESVAKAGGFPAGNDADDDEYEQEGFSERTILIRKSPAIPAGGGILAAIFDLAHSAQHKQGHPGRCTGNCARCPDHYGYRYGRWYYGRHHTSGCEFGGNDASGGL